MISFLRPAVFLVVSLVMVAISTAAPDGGDWPRLLRVYFRPGTGVEAAAQIFAKFGAREYSGDPTPKKLLEENSFDLEIIETSQGAGNSVAYTEVAVPAGQEKAWQKVFEKAPEVTKVVRPNLTTRAPDPTGAVPASAYPLQAETQTIALSWLKKTDLKEVVEEVERFMTTTVLAGKGALNNYRIRNPERRRVLIVTNARDVFFNKGFQNVIYDVTLLDEAESLSLLLTLQAKYAAGVGTTAPPAVSYRELKPEESAALLQYQLKVENQLVDHLKAWRSPKP